MPVYKPPRVEVIALVGFMARPGHAVRPGERVSVTHSVANTAIACHQARLPTAEDEATDEVADDEDSEQPLMPEQDPPRRPDSRDPRPVSRDPKRRTR